MVHQNMENGRMKSRTSKKKEKTKNENMKSMKNQNLLEDKKRKTTQGKKMRKIAKQEKHELCFSPRLAEQQQQQQGCGSSLWQRG